jgi:short-subunit dehydrogenase
MTGPIFPRRRAADAARRPGHILITGASSGLGRALALHYAAPGRTLSLLGRDAGRLAAVAAACRERGAAVDTASIDVTDREAMAQWISARDASRPIDMLIANAGMGGAAVVAGPCGEGIAKALEIVSVNSVGVVNAVGAVLPRMGARRCGQLVLVGSLAALIGLPQSPAYSASKAAVKVYGDALRRLLRPRGITVTNVLPGFIDTPMSRSLAMRRPWCWDADRAARRIARDVERGAAQCVFPWQLRLAVGLQNFVPIGVVDLVLALGARLGPSPPGARSKDESAKPRRKI